ncbi:MAG: hypothetical protein AAF206_13130 [Bacteroidota bacterium]
MKIKNIVSSLAIALWMLLAGYVSIGGMAMIEATEEVRKVEERINEEIVYEIVDKNGNSDSVFESLSRKGKPIHAQEKEVVRRLEKVYWYFGHPEYSYILFLTIMPFFPLLFLVAGSNGVLGAMIKLFYDHFWNKIPIKDSNYIVVPILGFGLGVAVFTVSYSFGSLFGSPFLSIVSMLSSSLFAGWFSKMFRTWIISKLPIQEEKPEGAETIEKQ